MNNDSKCSNLDKNQNFFGDLNSDKSEFSIHDRYVAIKILFSFHYSSDCSELLKYSDFIEMLEEDGIIIKKESIEHLIAAYKENEHLAEQTINNKFKNNNLDDFLVLPSVIMKMIYVELIVLKGSIKICMGDYLSIAKIFGLSRAEIGLINALLQQIYVEC